MAAEPKEIYGRVSFRLDEIKSHRDFEMALEYEIRFMRQELLAAYQKLRPCADR